MDDLDRYPKPPPTGCQIVRDRALSVAWEVAEDQLRDAPETLKIAGARNAAADLADLLRAARDANASVGGHLRSEAGREAAGQEHGLSAGGQHRPDRVRAGAGGPHDGFIDIATTADRMGIQPRTVRRRAAAGHLPLARVLTRPSRES